MTDHNIAGRPRPRRARQTAGAFDIRNVIGALLSVYGVILLLTAAFRNSSPEGTNNNDNWWGGLVLLVVGLVFIGWAKLRPVVVEGAARHRLGQLPGGAVTRVRAGLAPRNVEVSRRRPRRPD